MFEKESKTDAMKDLKVEIFDILREQETLKDKVGQLEGVKKQKVQKLLTLEK